MRAYAFLAGAGLDHKHRAVADILAFSPEEYEKHHDFIQWAFPVDEASRFNPQAPILTESEVFFIKRARNAQRNIQLLTDQFIDNLVCDTDRWLVPQSHIHLRISRVLRSLALLTSLNNALGLYGIVSHANDSAGSPIPPSVRQHWARSVRT